MVRTGELDQRVTLQALDGTSDGMGGNMTAWANYPSTPMVWAKVAAGGGSERFEHDRMNATASYTFTVRYRDDIDENDRLLWDGVPYNIRQIKRHAGRELFLEIVTERGATNGA